MKLAQEDFEAVLAARHFGYALYQSLLGDEPSSVRLQAVSLPLVREAYAVLGREEPVGLLATLGDVLGDVEGRAKQLTGEYTRLFVGPAKLPAPPWESVYTTGEQVLFQRQTLEVRNAYRVEGFIPAQYPQVADDHIAIELDFLGKLAGRALAAHQAGDVEGRDAVLDASARFLHDHLLVWVQRFASDVAASGKSEFYAQVASAMAAFAKADAELVARLLGK